MSFVFYETRSLCYIRGCSLPRKVRRMKGCKDIACGQYHEKMLRLWKVSGANYSALAAKKEALGWLK